MIKIKTKNVPIDIIYKPVKKEDEIIECFFSWQVNLAYRPTFSKNCTGKPGYVYNFNIQNLLTFEENFKFKRDIPMTIYIDFETTAPTNDCLDPEAGKMNAV